jgi:hypothetical protein
VAHGWAIKALTIFKESKLKIAQVVVVKIFRKLDTFWHA